MLLAYEFSCYHTGKHFNLIYKLRLIQVKAYCNGYVWFCCLLFLYSAQFLLDPVSPLGSVSDSTVSYYFHQSLVSLFALFI